MEAEAEDSDEDGAEAEDSDEDGAEADWDCVSGGDDSVEGAAVDADSDADWDVGAEVGGEVGGDVGGLLDVVGGEDRVDGHGEGVTPFTGVGGSLPVTVTHGSGLLGDVDGEVDVEGEVDGEVVGGGGGVVGRSCR